MADMARAEAWELLTEYNHEEFHLRHARIMEGVMRWFANRLGYGEEADFWALVGLLHDLDYERYPDEHGIKTREILRERGANERLIHAIISHCYGLTMDVEPEHEMEKVLFAADELTGLIGAVMIMRPSGSLDDLELRSVMKKYKSKAFAAGCSREVIAQGASMLGWELEELVGQSLDAMRTCPDCQGGKPVPVAGADGSEG